MLTDDKLAEGQQFLAQRDDALLNYETYKTRDDWHTRVLAIAGWAQWRDEHAEALLTGYVELRFLGMQMDGMIGELRARVKGLEAKLHPPIEDWGRLDSN